MATSGEKFDKKETPALGAAPAQEQKPADLVSPAMQRMRDMEQMGKMMKMQKLVERICKAHDKVLWPKLDWSKVAGSTINELKTLFEQGFDRFAGVNSRPNNPIVFLKNKTGQRREFAIVLNPEQKISKSDKARSDNKKVREDRSEGRNSKRSFEDLKLDWAGRWDQMSDQDKVALARSISEKLKSGYATLEAAAFELSPIIEFMDAVGIPKNQREEFERSVEEAYQNSPETRAKRELHQLLQEEKERALGNKDPDEQIDW